MIETGTLTCTKGTACATLEKRFAEMLGAQFAVALASGSAAVHVAVAAIDPEPGDEIITTSITDMGALTPILYQGAIPVFADVDPLTCNVTAATIAARLSDRTKAIIVTHLFGNPCEMTPILGSPAAGTCRSSRTARRPLAAERQMVGTFGAVGCFSLQQGKHITTGEGGLVVTDDPQLARRMRLFVNKAWGYGDANRSLLPRPQLPADRAAGRGGAGSARQARVERPAAPRHGRATQAIADLPESPRPTTPPGRSTATGGTASGSTAPSSRAARPRSAPASRPAASPLPRYIQKPAFRCEVLRDQRTFGNSRFPFTLARPEAVDYREENFPGTFRGLEQILVLPWNERFTEEHVDFIADSIRREHARLTRG